MKTYLIYDKQEDLIDVIQMSESDALKYQNKNKSHKLVEDIDNNFLFDEDLEDTFEEE